MVYILDVDGTICDRDSTELYPHVIAWLRSLNAEDSIYLATNQGGVGLRYWMEQGEFGEPEKYPTADMVHGRLNNIARKIEFITGKPVVVKVCFAYRSKSSGINGPVPMVNGQIPPEWDINNRKPNPGMLLDIRMGIPLAEKATCLFIGDREEDATAALRAGMQFASPDFFSQASPGT